LLEQIREGAIEVMVRHARTMGPNGVVAVRLSTSQNIGGGAEVLTYATAVVFVEG